MITVIGLMYIWVLVLALHRIHRRYINLAKWLKVAQLRPELFKQCMEVTETHVIMDCDKLNALLTNTKEDKEFAKWVNGTK